jgi:hypothetical protein
MVGKMTNDPGKQARGQERQVIRRFDVTREHHRLTCYFAPRRACSNFERFLGPQLGQKFCCTINSAGYVVYVNYVIYLEEIHFPASSTWSRRER